MSTSASPSAAENAPQPRAFNIKRAAQLLGINHSHLRRLALAGHVASIRAGRKLLFTSEALDAFLKTGCQPVPVPKTEPKS